MALSWLHHMILMQTYNGNLASKEAFRDCFQYPRRFGKAILIKEKETFGHPLMVPRLFMVINPDSIKTNKRSINALYETNVHDTDKCMVMKVIRFKLNFS